MPTAPKQRKIAIVGSRSVGMVCNSLCGILFDLLVFSAGFIIHVLAADTLHQVNLPSQYVSSSTIL